MWQGLRDDLACHGPDEVGEIFASQRDDYPEIEGLELIDAEHHAIMHAHGDGLRQVEGISLPDGIYNLFTISGGKVQRIDDFANRGQAFAAAGLIHG